VLICETSPISRLPIQVRNRKLKHRREGDPEEIGDVGEGDPFYIRVDGEERPDESGEAAAVAGGIARITRHSTILQILCNCGHLVDNLIYITYTVGMAHHTTKNIKELRTRHGMTQEYLAQKLGISRPTLIKVEKGERALTKREEDQVRDLFGIVEAHTTKNDMRINIPQRNLTKFKQVLLYVLEKTAGKHNIGMTALYKLLYFIDFDYYEKFDEQLMGLTYIKNHYGPTPREFVSVVDAMKKNGELEEVKSNFFQYEQRKFLPRTSADLASFSAQEKEMIDSVLARYGDKTATELTRLSHEDTPWVAAEDGKNIEYEHVFYRTDGFSVREYDEL